MRLTGNPTGASGVVATVDAPDGRAGVADLSAGVVCPMNQLHAWHCKKALHLHQTPGV